MSENNMKRLGDYIRPVDVRNRDLKVTRLLGVSITKEFMPSIANIVGTDLSAYKVVTKGQFAYGPVTSRNGDKISVALLDGYDDAIISQAYTVFEVVDTNALDPEYLMMWFRRPEFDRYARFHSHGSAREVFDWEEMCEVQVPVPAIEKQREIVAEYNTLATRIETNKKLIATLEQTAQTLYRHTFIDNIDPNNLPQGWRMGTLGEVCSIKGGKRLPKGEELVDTPNSHPYIRVADMCDERFVSLNDDFQYVEDDVQKEIKRYIVNAGDVIISIVGTIGNVNIVDETLDNANLTENCVKLVNLQGVSSYYLYALLTSPKGIDAINEGIVGGVQSKLPLYNIERIPVVLADKETMDDFSHQSAVLSDSIRLKMRENISLKSMQTLLLSKMGA